MGRLSRTKKEIKLAIDFQQSHLYHMLKYLSEVYDSFNDYNEELSAIRECEKEMERHPEWGMYSMRREPYRGEILGDRDTFRFRPDKLNFGNWFLFYHYNNFDFDEDFEKYLERIQNDEDTEFTANVMDFYDRYHTQKVCGGWTFTHHTP